MIKFFALLSLAVPLFCSQAYAADTLPALGPTTPPTLDQSAFSPATLSLQALILTTLNIDRIQTNREASIGLYELNPVLGRYPHRSRVNNYFFGVALAHTGAVLLLPPDDRLFLQGVTLGIEGATIFFNVSNGLGK